MPFRMVVRRSYIATLGLAAIVALCDWSGGGSVCANEPPALTTESDVLLLTAGGPVAIRVTCRLDEAAVESSVRTLSQRLMPLFDGDRDGSLLKDEAAKLPAYGRFGQSWRVGEFWSELDVAPRDGSISTDELAAHIAASLQLRLQLTAGSSARAQRLDLRQRLDTNGDGLITADELQRAAEALHQCDFDNDGTYSLVELESLAQARVDAPEGRGPLSALLPFLPLDTVPAETAASLIETTQSAAHTAAGNSHSADVDGDGRITLVEARAYLAALQPVYMLSVAFDARGNAQLEWGAVTEGGGPAETLRLQRRSELLTVQPGGVDVQLSWQRADVVSPILRPLLATQFGVADRNGNKYIEAAEFPGLDLPGREFDDVDFDANGEITRDEFDAFIEQEMYLSQLQVTATVENDIGSLFEQLDKDGDRRLCPRELRADADAAGAVAADMAETTLGPERGKHTLVFAQGVPRLSSQQNKNERRPGRSSAGRQPVVSAPTEGPLWFRRMDRNQDGDVSWGEFLGTREAFERLDSDRDGLIDTGEAGDAGP